MAVDMFIECILEESVHTKFVSEHAVFSVCWSVSGCPFFSVSDRPLCLHINFHEFLAAVRSITVANR